MELYVKVFTASYTDQTTCSYEFNIVFYHMFNIQCHCEQNVTNPFQPCKFVCVGTQKALENPIDWKARLNIALNCAEGGEYLTLFFVKIFIAIYLYQRFFLVIHNFTFLSFFVELESISTN